MKRISRILICAFLFFAIVAAWLWWVRPESVDMATYAPANSLLYLESNRPSEVVESLAGTDAWKSMEKAMGVQHSTRRSHWFQRFVGWTGIGPIRSVIVARAQLAVVVTDLRTTEEQGDTLRIKPEAAAIIETHTRESRIRAPIEQALQRLAEMTYGQPVSRRTTIDGLEFMEWTEPAGIRQIVATILGSLVIVGNSEQAVQNCLAVSRGQRPSLKDDPELARMRSRLAGEHALAFGYVPPANSARLLSVGVPLILGQAPADSEFQRLLTAGAAKVFGSLGWSSHPLMTGVEDRYFISLEPTVIARLKPNFNPGRTSAPIQKLLPDDVYSVTDYKFENPAAAWQSMKTAVSSQTDALSAVLFSSLLKSALVSYGIDEPETFLQAVSGDILTMRLSQDSERSLLVAHVRDPSSLHQLFARTMGMNIQSDRVGHAEILEDSKGEIAVSFFDELVVVGSLMDVRGYVENAKANGTMLSDESLRRMTFFVPSSSSANIVTYTNDSDRVRSFFWAIMAAREMSPLPTEGFAPMLRGLPYSATETTLGEKGLERITRSPLGQFSTLLPMLVPDQPRALKTSLRSE